MPDKLPDRRSCRVEPKERMMKMKRKGKLWKVLAAGMAAIDAMPFDRFFIFFV